MIIKWINNYADTLEEAGFGPAGHYIQNVQNFWGGIIEQNSGQHAVSRPTTRQPAKTETTRRAATSRTPKPPVAGCGRRLNIKEAYITSGFDTRPGDWPWHAALYHVSQK